MSGNTVDEYRQRFAGLSAAELREKLYQASMETPDGEMDFELIDALVGLLQEADPVEVDVDAAWRDFCDHYSFYSELLPEEEIAGLGYKRRPRRTGLRALLIAGLLAVLLLLIAAAKLGLFRVTLGADTTSLTSWAADNGRAAAGPVSADEYASLPEALDHYGLDVAVPAWIPERYVQHSLNVSEMEEEVIFNALYAEPEGDGELMIRVDYYSAGVPDSLKATFETDGTFENYDGGHGAGYLVVSNLGLSCAIWEPADTGCFCTISGDITSEELKQMLSSIS